MVVKTLPSKKLNTGNPRPSGRATDELRQVTIETDVNAYAEGSCLISFGNTKVLCTASVEEKVPGWLRGQKQGWVTAEYGMLPRSTHSRIDREASRGKQSGRTQEIQRLIGRSLRAITDLRALKGRTITVDCDVLVADGGTRTAAITGSYVALYQALDALKRYEHLEIIPLKYAVAATSVGICGDTILLDMCYAEDQQADADFNIVMADDGRIIEIQGTAENQPFSVQKLYDLVSLSSGAIDTLFEAQKAAITDLSHISFKNPPTSPSDHGDIT